MHKTFDSIFIKQKNLSLYETRDRFYYTKKPCFTFQVNRQQPIFQELQFYLPTVWCHFLA